MRVEANPKASSEDLDVGTAGREPVRGALMARNEDRDVVESEVDDGRLTAEVFLDPLDRRDRLRVADVVLIRHALDDRRITREFGAEPLQRNDIGGGAVEPAQHPLAGRGADSVHIHGGNDQRHAHGLRHADRH